MPDQKIKAIREGKLVFSDGNEMPIPHWNEEGRLVLFLLRHAEKGEGFDPDLTGEGRKRARKLQQLLKEVRIDGFFATNAQRTYQTAEPAAEQQGLEITEYNPLLQIPLVRKQRARQDAQNLLIVGHLNTVPMLLNYLIDSSNFSDIPFFEYDNFYIVVWRKNEEKSLLHLKY
jgi:broad specificity phosphatase PhoE